MHAVCDCHHALAVHLGTLHSLSSCQGWYPGATGDLGSVSAAEAPEGGPRCVAAPAAIYMPLIMEAGLALMDACGCKVSHTTDLQLS